MADEQVTPEQIKELRIRIAQLENEVAALSRALAGGRSAGIRRPAPPQPVTQPAPVRTAVPAPAAVVAQGSAAPPAPASEWRETPRPVPSGLGAAAEANLVGTWFSRLGVVAILLGAGFGFKYAVDRGIIGPGARVAIGVAAGALLLAWGEWARRKPWPMLAQAITGGGVALLTLSIWAATELYDLIPSGPAFALLVGVSALGAGLALLHRAQALAVLAAIGGFIDPLLIGLHESSPASLYGYLLVLDVAIVAIAFARAWPVLAYTALAGSWIIFGLGASDPTADDGVAFGYATVLFALFVAGPLVRSAARGARVCAAEAPYIWANAAIYFGVGIALLDDTDGLFSAVLGAICLGLWLFARAVDVTDRWQQSGYLAAGMAFLTVAIPLEVHAPWIGVLWAVEGVGLIWIGRAQRETWPSIAGIALGAMGLMASVVAFGDGGYDGDRLVASAESLVLLLQAASVFVAGWLLGSDPEEGWKRAFGPGLGLVGHGVVVAWLGLEANAAVERRFDAYEGHRVAFALAVAWAVYGAGMAWLGKSLREPVTSIGSLAVLGAATIAALGGLGEPGAYSPARAIVSPESLVMVALAAAAFGTAWVYRTTPGLSWGPTLSAWLALGGHVATLAWLSLEANAAVQRSDVGDERQAIQFTLSAIWALYATAAMVVGVRARLRSLRFFALGLFGIVIGKMAFADLWTLETGYRFVGFIGLGVVLLLVSLMYHRFRDIVLGEDADPAQP